MTNYTFLRTHHVVDGAPIAQLTENEHALELSSPANTLLQDFTMQTPVCIQADTPILAARKLASATPTDALLVVDEQNKLIGVTSSVELQSVRVTTQALQMGLKPSELLVHDVMRSVHTLPCVAMKSVANTNLGTVLTTMEHTGSFYLLVSENAHIRGVFCARKIAKELGIALDITPVAQSFHDVVASVEHPH
ncbi:CBS domain-containing protein [Pseudoalteromonas sp. SSDWG2]|uniref:CBS domain-containing protein n=1 Tax=Pseudoalteromonas sp. SSDWG2 TaxID=3139391 RepID=UPI003BADA1EC